MGLKMAIATLCTGLLMSGGAALADEYREHLLEAASHGDDHLLELDLEGKPVSEELLRKALHA